MATDSGPGTTGDGTGTREPPPARPDATTRAVTGLLDRITATSLDEDYTHVAERRAREGTAAPRTPRAGGVAILVVFGVLLAVAAVQTSRDAPASASNRDYLVSRINTGQESLTERRDRIDSLQDEIAELEQQNLNATATGRALQEELAQLGVMAGVTAVTGPGIRVEVDDAPDASTDAERVLDRDLQHLVNGLWEVGAEAIAINGQRLTVLSAIRQAGGTITVNFRNVSPPFVISAIGDPDTLASEFIDTAGAQRFLVNQSRYGLEFSIDQEGSLSLQSASRSSVRYATAVAEDGDQGDQANQADGGTGQ